MSGLSRHVDKGLLQVRGILAKVEERGHLSLEDVGFLLSQEDPQVREAACLVAGRVKEKHFGKHISLFAPLYLSNDCVNNCLYCGFRRDNDSVGRRTLTVPEAAQEARVLAERGFRRIVLVAAEHPAKISAHYLCQVVEAVLRETPINAIAVNAAPMPTEAFRALRESGALAYQCFQETYQPLVYCLMHPSGRKHNFAWRIEAMDRAIAAGFAQVGMGVLLGLWDFRSDVTAMVAHARSLLSRSENLAVVLSLPRFRAAVGARLRRPPFPVSDDEFALAVAVCRLAVPSAEIAISTRERPEIRDGLMEQGASMMSAGSVTWPGGYTPVSDCQATGQFTIKDTRSAEQVYAALAARGLTPVYQSVRLHRKLAEHVES